MKVTFQATTEGYQNPLIEFLVKTADGLELTFSTILDRDLTTEARKLKDAESAAITISNSEGAVSIWFSRGKYTFSVVHGRHQAAITIPSEFAMEAMEQFYEFNVQRCSKPPVVIKADLIGDYFVIQMGEISATWKIDVKAGPLEVENDVFGQLRKLRVQARRFGQEGTGYLLFDVLGDNIKLSDEGTQYARCQEFIPAFTKLRRALDL